MPRFKNIFEKFEIVERMSYRIDDAIDMSKWPKVMSIDKGALMLQHQGLGRDDPDIMAWHRHYKALDIPHITILKPTEWAGCKYSLELWKPRRCYISHHKVAVAVYPRESSNVLNV